MGESGTSEMPEGSEPKWQDKDVMFAGRKEMDRQMHRPSSAKYDKENYEETKVTTTANKFCYLCTTLEEHQQHIARVRGGGERITHPEQVKCPYR